MCKIITLTNISRVKSLKKLVNKCAALVSESERDGFGYAIQTATGVYGERTLRPESFVRSIARPIFEAPFASPQYERFGTQEKATGAALFHGRTSTNDVSLLNTHPIQKHDWTLIHNGVVSNHGPEYIQTTSNDTEHLVEYMATTGISGIETHLTGYYAFAALAPDGTLHVVRDSTASLYVASVESIDSLIFATSEDHINQLCDEMSWKPSVVAAVVENSYIQFSAGAIVSHTTIKPRGRTSYESSFASRSLGRSLESLDVASTFQKPETFRLDDMVEYSAADNSESLFLREIEMHGDSSYTFRCDGRDLSFDEFMDLDDDEKLCCEVIRPDGTVCDQTNYNVERLYGS